MRHTDPFPHPEGAITFHDIVTMTLETRTAHELWHHQGALWNFYGILRNVQEQLRWLATNAWPTSRPSERHLFFYRIIWSCFTLYDATKNGALESSPIPPVSCFQKINNLMQSAYWTFTILRLHLWFTTRQDQVQSLPRCCLLSSCHPSASPHSLLGRSKKWPWLIRGVNEGTFTDRWSDVSVLTGRSGRIVLAYKCDEISTYVQEKSHDMIIIA